MLCLEPFTPMGVRRGVEGSSLLLAHERARSSNSTFLLKRLSVTSLCFMRETTLLTLL